MATSKSRAAKKRVAVWAMPGGVAPEEVGVCFILVEHWLLNAFVFSRGKRGRRGKNHFGEGCKGAQKCELIKPAVVKLPGSTGGLICSFLRASEWPSLKTTTPVPKWRMGSIPS